MTTWRQDSYRRTGTRWVLEYVTYPSVEKPDLHAVMPLINTGVAHKHRLVLWARAVPGGTDHAARNRRHGDTQYGAHCTPLQCCYCERFVILRLV